MPTLSSILEGARDVAKTVTYSASHPGHEVVAQLSRNLAKMEKALASAKSRGDAGLAGQLQATIEETREQLAAESGVLQSMRAGKEKLTGQLSSGGSALTAAAGAGSIGYMANRLAEPDAESRFKIGEWVDGFVEKCAEYGVDGVAFLDEAVNGAGDVKTAAKLLPGIMKIMHRIGGAAGAVPALATLGIGAGYLASGIGDRSARSYAASEKAVRDAEKLEGGERRQWLTENKGRTRWQNKYNDYLSGLRSARHPTGEPMYKTAPSYEDYIYHAGTGAPLTPSEKWTEALGTGPTTGMSLEDAANVYTNMYDK